jgi:predicted proteasome-type protease
MFSQIQHIVSSIMFNFFLVVDERKWVMVFVNTCLWSINASYVSTTSTLYNNLQVGNPLHLNIQHQICSSCMHLANACTWKNYKDIIEKQIGIYLKEKIILQTKKNIVYTNQSF